MSRTEQTVRLGAELASRGMGGYLAHTPSTITNLTGFNEGPGERFSSLVVNTDGDYVLICPALSVNQAKRAGIADLRGLLDGVDPIPVVKEVFEKLGVSGTVAFDDMYPGIHLVALQNGFSDMSFVPGGKVFGALSRTKNAEEAKLLDMAGAYAVNAYERVAPKLKAGLTESAVDLMLREAMAEQGGVPAFSIVAAAANGAECHHHTDETVIKTGDVVIMDFGCDVGGFKSDITRTVAFGEPTEKQKEVYRVVYRSHMAAREAIRPGVTAGELDKAARDVIEEAGYGEYFVHRLGHGLGREIHEEPYILPQSDEELKVGDVFSIEPGIYIPGDFGVRIENIVMLTEDGHHSFNADPPAELPVVG